MSIARDPQGDSLLLDRLAEARARAFVGRRAELAAFRSALAGPRPDRPVIWVHGPGGVGKTALLHAFAGIARAAGGAVARVDMREAMPSPPAFLEAVAEGAGDGAAFPAGGGRPVLLVDTFERAAPMGPWLRERFLPGLPADAIVVIAGRAPPPADWEADPAWGALTRPMPLGKLAADDALAYLAAAGVPERLRDDAIDLTRGHPLALALLARAVAQGDPPVGLAPAIAGARDLIGPLHRRFVEGVPSARHRAALEALAHVGVATEGSLRALLPGDGATADLFSWLRDLPFVDEQPDGLRLHDLVREVVDADLRWRDRAAYRALRRRARADLMGRIRSSAGPARRRAIADMVRLHRTNPLMAANFRWDGADGAYGDDLRAGDGPAILALAERHEGPESVAIIAHWMDRQPGGFRLLRDRHGHPRGFALILALHEATAGDRARDPGARAMWDHAHRVAAPRPGEEVYAARALIDAERHQRPSVTTAIAANASLERLFAARRLAWDFIGPWRDPDAVAEFMAYMDYHRAPGADYVVDGRAHGVYAHDFRRTPLDRMLEMTHGRELEDDFAPGDMAPPPPAAAGLAEREFADAVRRALDDLHRDERLARNPLIASRIVPPGAAPAALREAIADAVDLLRIDPRDARAHRALARTFIRPAPTREAAARALGLPHSTYRRHLREGLRRVTEILWQRELYGEEGGAADG